MRGVDRKVFLESLSISFLIKKRSSRLSYLSTGSTGGYTACISLVGDMIRFGERKYS